MSKPSPPTDTVPTPRPDDRVSGPVLYLATSEGDPKAGDERADGDGAPIGSALDQVLPVLPLRNSVLYPGALMPLAVGRPKTLRLLNAVGTGGTIAVVSQRDKDTDNPQPDELYWVGTAAKILRVHHEDENTLHVVVQGIERLRCTEFVQTEPYIIARVEHAPVEDEDSVEIQALIRSIKEMAAEIIELIPELPSGAVDLVNHIDSPSRLAYMVMTHLAVPVEDKQEVLQEDDVRMALRRALGVLNEQLEVLRVSQRINSEVKGEMNKNQREFFLRQQLKAIRKELGEEDDEEDFVEQLRERLMAAGLPEDAQKVANKELNRLRSIQPSSPEYTVARTYLEWLADLPWQRMTPDNHDIARARAILERDHDGLVKVKRRILEFLAVNSLKRDGRSPILCLVGPPGVGKTSLGKSVAEALGRKYQRMSLGGVRDEAEIRGHRRTYIGAMPGKFIQSMKRAESRNPLIILDEIDKVGRDWRGDPTSALLEVLDPEQNNTFMDHYLEVEYDLSNVMFLTTANSYNMPSPLLDRMEIIPLAGYTEDEKLQIAKQHLIAKQVHNHGLKKGEFVLTDAALTEMIRTYTREAGVRNLEREISKLARKALTRIIRKDVTKVEITPEVLEDYLGVKRFRYGLAEKEDQVGVVTGLAWTSVGGELLSIEALKLPGKGRMKTTGKLGDVMKESIDAAASYVRAISPEIGVKPPKFETIDIHVHVPEGATPKDGPSAGVAMVTSIVSVLTGIPVRKDIAMTGEVTLRGNVLPIGGLKEKLLAALRGGITTVLIPEENAKDLTEIPDNVKEGLTIIPVAHVREVLSRALVRKPEPVEWDEAAEEAAKAARDQRSESPAATAH